MFFETWVQLCDYGAPPEKKQVFLIDDADVDFLFSCIYLTSSTAQGGGGSVKKGNLLERLCVENHGWQSESSDGSQGGWSCLFGVAAMVAVITSPTTAGCSMV